MPAPDEIRARLRGPVNSLPTIFTRDGELDHHGIRSAIDRTIANGGNVIMLTWGDSLISLLTDDEVAAVHRTVIEHVDRRAVTIACDNMWGLNKALEFGRYVRELGFDLYMVRPAAWPGALGTPETLADYYRAVAAEMRVMLVGDVPLRTCELIEDEPNVLAFKEDFGLDYAHEVLLRWGDRWTMVGGGAMQRHHLLWPHGCSAWLDVFIRCRAAPCLTYWQALQRHDSAAAWATIRRYEQPLWQEARRVRYGFDGLMAHALLEIYGVAPRWRRSPAPNATDDELAALRTFLHGIGLL